LDTSGVRSSLVVGCYGPYCCVQDGAFRDKLRDNLSEITVMDDSAIFTYNKG